MKIQNSLIEQLASRMSMMEGEWKKIESHSPPVSPLTEAQLDHMNERLGFPSRVKGHDYRPYCMGLHCSGPRMHRIQDGFKCHICGNTWILHLQPVLS